MNKTKKVLIVAGIFIISLIVVWQLSSILYPSVSYKHYKITNRNFNENIDLPITFNKNIQSVIDNHVNLLISKKFDTNIYLDKIYSDKNTTNLVISFRTKWNYWKGECLTNYKLNNDGTSTYEMKKIKLLDLNNKEVPFKTICGGPDNTIIVSFDKKLITGGIEYKLILRGLNHLIYTRKS